MIVLNGEEGLECKVHVDGIRLEHISEFKSGKDGGECSRKVVSGRRVAGAIRSIFARDLSVLVLHETLLVPVLMYGSTDG